MQAGTASTLATRPTRHSKRGGAHGRKGLRTSLLRLGVELRLAFGLSLPLGLGLGLLLGLASSLGVGLRLLLTLAGRLPAVSHLPSLPLPSISHE